MSENSKENTVNKVADKGFDKQPKSKFSLVLGIVLLVTAIATFFYPTVANYINTVSSHSQLTNYDNNVKVLTDEEKQNYLKKHMVIITSY